MKQVIENIFKAMNKKIITIAIVCIFIGLIIGSAWQAINDTKTINKLLSDNADTSNLLTDGNTYYKITTYNLSDFNYKDYLYGNITVINNSCECGK